MNDKLSISCPVLIIATLFFSCGGPVQEENKNNAPTGSLSLHVGNEKYVPVDKKETVVAWRGSSVEGAHTGYVYISKGELVIENGQLMGGTVEVDMSTIEGDDHRSDNNLIKHLKDPDFFDVKKFPFSTIAITRVESTTDENKKVTGNLTIKGITHPVTFPASMEVRDGIMKANGKLVIDRTKWEVRYNSGKFYDNLADKTISDSIEFHIRIVAKIQAPETTTGKK
jgi:polyisoprenoid-binding protein YceI